VDLFGVDYFGHVVALAFPAAIDATIVPVGRRTRLQELILWESSSFGDAGLAHLKGLTNLSNLNLDNTKVTNAGLVHLTGLTNLSSLNLRSTHVTDAGLAHLKGLTKLSGLDLSKTQVAGAGMEELRQALPGRRITW
jgi:Leucine-rich repeat (LRR) protein